MLGGSDAEGHGLTIIQFCGPVGRLALHGG